MISTYRDTTTGFLLCRNRQVNSQDDLKCGFCILPGSMYYVVKTDKSKYDPKGQLKNGLFKEFFMNGVLSCVGKYKNGKMTGIWNRYHPNGELYTQGKYEYNIKTGVWKTYTLKGELSKIKNIPAINSPSKTSSSETDR